MCMYLTNANYLGSRLISYDFYDSKSKGFIGMSEKQVVNKLKAGEKIYGFVLGSDEGNDTLLLDAENFNMTNLQVKSGVNNLSWLNESDNDLNVGLIVVAISGGKKQIFETVCARHARVEYSEEKLKALIEIGAMVAGVRLEKNKIVLCEGVQIIENVNESE